MSPQIVPRMQQFARSPRAPAVARAHRCAVGLALAMAGCGFHLQGAGTLPAEMARTFVDTDRPHTEFLHSLTDVLRHAALRCSGAGRRRRRARHHFRRDGPARVLGIRAQHPARVRGLLRRHVFAARRRRQLDQGRIARRDARVHLRRDRSARESRRGEILREALAAISRGASCSASSARSDGGCAAARGSRHVRLACGCLSSPTSSRSQISIGARSSSSWPAMARGSSSSRRTRQSRARTGASAKPALIGDVVYVRADTPAHSLLHELCHFICMDDERRAALATDAGGSDDEESARVLSASAARASACAASVPSAVLRDMDVWGYSFREGSARAWFDGDGKDLRAVLVSSSTASSIRSKSRSTSYVRLRASRRYETVTRARRCAPVRGHSASPIIRAHKHNNESASMTAAEQDAKRHDAADADARAQR